MISVREGEKGWFSVVPIAFVRRTKVSGDVAEPEAVFLAEAVGKPAAEGHFQVVRGPVSRLRAPAPTAYGPP